MTVASCAHEVGRFISNCQEIISTDTENLLFGSI